MEGQKGKKKGVVCIVRIFFYNLGCRFIRTPDAVT